MKWKDSLQLILLLSVFLAWGDWFIDALDLQRGDLVDSRHRRKILSDLNMNKFITFCNERSLPSTELGGLATFFHEKYCWYPRFNEKKQLVTYEIFDKNLPVWLRASPLTPHIIRPIAKTNLRTYTASTSHMDEAIRRVFGEESGGGELGKSYRIGLFVSMSVQQRFRKLGFGDLLLRWGQFKCKELGCDYMLLIHDDKGSGKLVRYYEERGFRHLSFLLDKAMICPL